MSKNTSKTIVVLILGIVAGVAIVALWPLILATFMVLATIVATLMYVLINFAMWIFFAIGGIYIAYKLCKLISGGGK